MAKQAPSPNDIFYDISKMLSHSIHDINNPFCVILGQLSIVEILMSKEELNKEKILNSLNKMKNGTTKMQERIDGLRDYYKVAMGDASYANWKAIEKALLYVNMAFSEHDLDLDFPDQDCNPDSLQDLFIICYYLLKLHQAAGQKTKFEIRSDGNQTKITTQGNINPVEELDKTIFQASLERLSASFKLNGKTSEVLITV